MLYGSRYDKIPFRTRLQQGKPLLGDDAMGTMLHHESHDDIHTCFDALSVAILNFNEVWEKSDASGKIR